MGEHIKNAWYEGYKENKYNCKDIYAWNGHAIYLYHLLFLQEYFYGLSNDLSPHSSIASFSDFSIFRIGGGPQAPRSALPIGAEPAADPTRLVPININADLLHSILAVSYAKETDQIISR